MTDEQKCPKCGAARDPKRSSDVGPVFACNSEIFLKDTPLGCRPDRDVFNQSALCDLACKLLAARQVPEFEARVAELTVKVDALEVLLKNIRKNGLMPNSRYYVKIDDALRGDE